MIKVVIALLVIVIVARLILKGYRAEPVLFIAGLALMVCTWFTGWGTVLPKGVSGTGISFLDPFVSVNRPPYVAIRQELVT